MRVGAVLARRAADVGRKFSLVRRKRQVVGITRVGASCLCGELHQPDVEDVGYQIRDDRRARAALRQRIVMAGDLRDDRSDLVIQCKISVLDEETPDAAKVDRREEILQIKIEHPAPLPVLTRVRDDRAVTLESVRDEVFDLAGLLDLLHAVLEEIGETSLQFFKLLGGRLDRTSAARAVWDLE